MPTSSDGSIAVNRVWKRFRADRRHPSLRDQLGTVAHRFSRDEAWSWVLRDVDFRVAPGESLGIVGSNGAGKSTLLKVLTGVMYPYAGKVEIPGRIGALIEIRGGMHPELTGRENTFMYGSLLGLTRREIRDRFDEIVAFADVGRAIDRQLKYYSSGMQMRLGFAVAAFLRPDVLLVDEVLAVGDAWFQQRCLDRMREVLHEGTTLVLVSHDLASMEATCARALWLDQGVVVADGAARQVLGAYRQAVESFASEHLDVAGDVRVTAVSIDHVDGGMPTSFQPIVIDLALDVARPVRGRLHVGISEGSATPVLLASTPVDWDAGPAVTRCVMDHVPLPRGRYSVWVYAESHDDLDLTPWHPVGAFHLGGTDLDPAPTAVVRLSPVHVQASWQHDEAPGGP